MFLTRNKNQLRTITRPDINAVRSGYITTLKKQAETRRFEKALRDFRAILHQEYCNVHWGYIAVFNQYIQLIHQGDQAHISVSSTNFTYQLKENSFYNYRCKAPLSIIMNKIR